MADNKNIVVRLLADTSQYEASLAKAGQSTDTLAGGLEKTGSKTGLIGKGLTVAGLAAAAFGAAAVKMTADFDQQMSTVQANTGATSAELEQLRQAAIDAGADTVYSASESADAINDLGKAGMSTTDILSGGLSGALNLAASDGMAVGDAAEYMANALTMFHLSGAQATQVADALAAGAGKAVGGVSDFGEALNNCGGQAYSFGMSMQETVGVLGLFAQNGVIGAEAGTQLNSMLMKLANPSTAAANTMKELGISAYDASGNFVGMANFAGQLQEAEKNLTQEQRNQANATMFGSYAIKAANYLYAAGKDGVEQWTEAVSESGYAAEQAAAKNNNLKGDLENLSGSMESLMLKIGEGAQGPIRKLVQGIDSLVDAFSSLPASAQQWIVLGGSMIGVIGGLHKAMTPLNTSTSKLSQSLGLALDPFQRLSSAAPQLTEGIMQLGVAAVGSGPGFEQLANGMTRSQLAGAGLKSIGSGLMSLLGGPFGLALTAAVAGLTIFIQKNQEAKQRTQELANAIKSTGDATDTLIDNVTSGNNMDWGWFQKLRTGYGSFNDMLKDAGLNAADFAKAVHGDKDAIDKYNDAMLALSDKKYDSTYQIVGEATAKLNQQTKAYNEATEQVKDNKEAKEQLAEADGKAADSADSAADSISGEGDAASDAADQISDLVKAVFNLEGSNLDADEAVTAMRQKILDLSDSLTENGKCLDDNGNALDGCQKKAYAMQDSLQGLASSAQQAATKILENGEATGDMEAATRRAGDALDEARQSFINNAVQAGMTQQAAEALADAYGLQRGKVDELKSSIDALKDKNVKVTTEGTETAKAQIKTVSDALAALKDKNITVTQTFRTINEIIGISKKNAPNYVEPGNTPDKAGGYTGGMFDGSIFARYANGGQVFSGYVDPKWAGQTGGKKDNVYLANARLDSGEFVTNAEATSYYGIGLMQALNRKALPKKLYSAAPAQPIIVKVESTPSRGDVTVNMPMKIVRPASELASAGTIVGRKVAKAIQGANL